ncbi:MAG: hypothetical protein M1830_010389, partial [Pleopsidium flavum]
MTVHVGVTDFWPNNFNNSYLIKRFPWPDRPRHIIARRAVSHDTTNESMGAHKRVKTNPLETPAAGNSLPRGLDAPEEPNPPAAPRCTLGEAGVEKKATAVSENSGADGAQRTKSWYGGTWPRVPKAAPVTQVARESISAASVAASELMSSARPQRTPSGPVRSPSLYLSRSLGCSSRSLPVAATTTKLNITSNAASQPQDSTEHKRSPEPEEANNTGDSDQASGAGKNVKIGEEMVKPEQITQNDANVEQKNSEQPDTAVSQSQKPINESASWLGWFTKTAGRNGDETSLQGRESGGSPTRMRPDELTEQEGHEPVAHQTQRRQSDPSPLSDSITTTTTHQPASWFGLWGNAAVALEEGKPTTAREAHKDPHPLPLVSEDTPQEQIEDLVKGSMTEVQKSAITATRAARSSGWAFWSRDSTSVGDRPKPQQDDTGVLAVADMPSQSSPAAGTAEGVTRLGKRERPQSLEVADETVSGRESRAIAYSASSSAVSKTKMTDLVASKQLQKVLPNLVLPTFASTYRPQQNLTLLQQLGRLLKYGRSPDTRHVHIVQDPPRIKKALAIGVHGYFPVPLIRSVLGQPTGTSIRFANSASSAIKKWTESHGYSCDIEKIALEGEGKVAERVDLLWKLLLNWIEDIRKADFVLIACHSQGVPVTMMLVAKLITFGCVNSARIGVCAMAGVNLGPFSDYKSRWISGSAGELFDFARPDSKVSRDYIAALEIALRFGVRIVYIGSIDDQLSSTFGTISHPYVYRAVFVDGRVHAPDFLAHLVGFALKLRNLGISDHGLIRELSSPLAGSLYGGEGHSRIYDDESVYHLSVVHALETTSVSDLSLQVHKAGISSAQNPYILPFAMRGLLEEDYVRTELKPETNELLRQFDDWKPSSKVLRDVKFRLEG